MITVDNEGDPDPQPPGENLGSAHVCPRRSLKPPKIDNIIFGQTIILFLLVCCSNSNSYTYLLVTVVQNLKRILGGILKTVNTIRFSSSRRVKLVPYYTQWLQTSMAE